MGKDRRRDLEDAGIKDLRPKPKQPVTIRLTRREVDRMRELITGGPTEFDRSVDIRLMIMRLATWSDKRGEVIATPEARESFLMEDGSLNPNVLIRDD